MELECSSARTLPLYGPDDPKGRIDPCMTMRFCHFFPRSSAFLEGLITAQSDKNKSHLYALWVGVVDWGVARKYQFKMIKSH